MDRLRRDRPHHRTLRAGRIPGPGIRPRLRNRRQHLLHGGKQMSITITEPGIYSGIPNDVYHSDPTPDGSLSSSGAKKLIATTPLHFKWDRDHNTHKDVFDF